MKLNIMFFWRILTVGVFYIGYQTVLAEEKTRIVGPEVYQEVTTVVWAYLDALNGHKDQGVFEDLNHRIWNGKYANKNGTLRIENKDSFLAASNQERSDKTLKNFELTSVQIHYGDFAMARADDRARGGVSYLTLFKSHGQWQVTGEVYTEAGFGTRNPHFSSENSVNAVLEAMEIYYRAVEFGKPELLELLFHEDWSMKNPENGEIVSEGRVPFIARRAAGPTPGYYNDRQVTDIQILYDHLAILRVDNPTTKSTIMFTFFKLKGKWIMVDKAWSNHPDLKH